MRIDPSKYHVLLVGPRVHRMAPLVGARGYPTHACELGEEGLVALGNRAFHVVVVELELDDLETRDFLSRARVLRPDTSYVLLDDPSRTHLIVSTMAHGVDVYVPTPPDERAFFELLARQAFAAEARRETGDVQATLDELELLRRRVAELQAALERAQQENALLSAEVVDLNESLEEALKAKREAEIATDFDASTESIDVEGEILHILEDDDGDEDWDAEPTVAHDPRELADFTELPDTDASTRDEASFEVDLED